MILTPWHHVWFQIPEANMDKFYIAVNYGWLIDTVILLSIEVVLVVIWGCVYFDMTTIYSANYFSLQTHPSVPVTLVSLVET